MSSFPKATYVRFQEVTALSPSEREIRRGIYAMSKISGDLIKISRNFNGELSPSVYSCYTMADAFPSSSKYADKYADLVEAREVLKNDRNACDYDTIGKAIGLIKRFLDKHGKV